MSADDKDPESTEHIEGTDGPEREIGMVDRDDESPDPFTDADNDRAPDPGYSAFSNDFEDPLADWPGPDSSMPIAETGLEEPELVQVGLGHTEPPEANDPPGNERFASADLAFPDDNFPDATHAQQDGRAFFDTDEPSDPLPLMDSDEDEEDDFVDDFLNDLDPPERADGPIPADTLANSGATLSATSSLLATAGASSSNSIERARTHINDTAEAALSGDTMESNSQTEDEERSIPVVMIAVVVGALVLLGVGGYGVIQQRQSMQTEIRDLQSRLATAMTTEESAAVREQQRQLEVNYEGLSGDFDVLRTENERLREQLLAQEELLNSSVTDAPAEATQTASEAETDNSSGSEGTADTDNPPAATNAVDTSGWFVNFGSYTRRVVAEQWAEKLEVEQGTVTVQTATANDSTLYRVRVVGLESRDDAERVATRLERSFDLPRLWIGTQKP
jgi:cell division septation protein DedD